MLDDDLNGLDMIKHIEEGEEDEEEENKYEFDDSGPSFSEHLQSLERCENAIIIDGAYFEIGIKELERMHPSERFLSVPDNIKRLLYFIQNWAGIPDFDWKSFHSAEEPKVKKRKAYYSVLEDNGFVFDIREFKNK